MGSQILRPTTIKHQKGEWLIQGPWGRRTYDPMSKVSLYAQLHRELVASGVLPVDSPCPTNRYHGQVTMAVMRCSWIEERWVLDEPFRCQTEETTRTSEADPRTARGAVRP